MKMTITVALLALSGTALAQTAPSAELAPGSVQTFSGPVEHYRLSYATGKLTRLEDLQQVPRRKQAVSMTSYSNTCTVGSFIGVGTEEFVDWGTKAAGFPGLIDSFSFGYATDALDVAMSGPGASLEIAFYTGTTGLGVLGTEVARFAFTGLPGSADGVSFAGFALTVDLTAGGDFCLPDGAIGYGYCSSDPGTTGPLLIDIPSCPNGQVDAWDAWTCPASSGTYNGSFFLGGSPTVSFYMLITEDDGTEIATTTLNNGSGINPVLASDGGVPPFLGASWPVTVDNTGGYAASVGLWTLDAFPPGTLILSGGEVIMDITGGFVITNSVTAVGINDHSEFVPKILSLLGVDMTFQALLFGNIIPYQLTNGIDIHIGY